MNDTTSIDTSLLQAATEGQAEAQYRLGMSYSNPDFVDHDDEVACLWLDKAAKQGHLGAKTEIDRLRKNGRDVRPIKQAASMGYASSQYTLGLMYLMGKGVRADREQAIRWLKESAEQGFSKALLELAKLQSMEEVTEENNTGSNDLLFKAAAAGEKSAEDQLINNLGLITYLKHQANLGVRDCLFRLGECYYNGDPIEKNLEKASYWLGRAIDHQDGPHPGALFVLGKIKGSTDPLEAMRLQSHALKLNWPDALYHEAQRCSSLNDNNASFRYMQRAATHGHVLAMSLTGWAYYFGDGTTQNYGIAATWARKAAELGNCGGESLLSTLYSNGLGVIKDENAAFYWCKKSAENGGSVWVQKDLGLRYLEGRGVIANRDEAKIWLKKALNGGLHSVAELLRQLEAPQAIASIPESHSNEPQVSVMPSRTKNRPDGLIHKTMRGDKVRSKSEVIIANILYQSGLDYAYEGDLSQFGFERFASPDFLFSKGKQLLIWEHLGKLDDPAYKKRWDHKLQLYRAHGFEVGKNLFVSTESVSDGLDSDAVQENLKQIKHLIGSGEVVSESAQINRVKIHELVFFDFETTGLSPDAGDRVIEIGAVRFSGGRIKKRFSELIHPGFLISPKITEITQISNEMLRDAPRAEKVMPELARFMADAVVVAHNAKFDERFLRSEFGRLGLPIPHHILCTMKLAKRVVPGLRSYSLDALSAHFNLKENVAAHRALPDAEQTVALWNALEQTIHNHCPHQNTSINLMLKLQDVQPIKSAYSFVSRWRDEFQH